MSSNWIEFADRILNRLATIHPGVETYSALVKLEPYWQDNRGLIKQGFDFLVEHQLIKNHSNDNYICTNKGLSVSSNGIEKFIGDLETEKEKDIKKDAMTLELLQHQLDDIKRKNKYWRIAAFAGVVSFIYNVLQIFGVV